MFDKRIKFINPDGRYNGKITFSSSYYCWNFLSKQIIMEELKTKTNILPTIKNDNNYALKLASKNGHLEGVKYLISIDANVKANNNNYALRRAAYNKHLEVVEYIKSL
ncbi:MAG: ankyrin repeat domain-containing protein [Clostridiales bacterium]|nr:ankyrin repeat domain-containing protein [Clostridiales bacterium]